MAKNATTARRPWLLPIIFGAAAIIVIVTVFALLFTDREPTETTANTSPQANTDSDTDGGAVDVTEPDESEQMDLTYVERRDPDDLLAIGEVDAPVVLVVFSDYQCPFCASWSDETLPEMMDYVDDGQLRIEWRDVNIYGAPSERASKASLAAGLQGQFWEYHERLYPQGEIRSESELSEEALIDLADELELDVEQFTTDMESGAVAEQIAQNEKLGTDMGAYSTPAFLLGGEPMVGAQPTQVFVDAVDEALASAQE